MFIHISIRARHFYVCIYTCIFLFLYKVLRMFVQGLLIKKIVYRKRDVLKRPTHVNREKTKESCTYQKRRIKETYMYIFMSVQSAAHVCGRLHMTRTVYIKTSRIKETYTCKQRIQQESCMYRKSRTKETCMYENRPLYMYIFMSVQSVVHVRARLHIKWIVYRKRDVLKRPPHMHREK